MKEVKNQIFWTFELGTQEGVNVPIWLYFGFQQKDRQDSPNLNNDAFFRPPVTNALCNVRTKKYQDAGTSLNNHDDDYSQGYGQIEEAFTVLTKDDIIKP